MAVIGNPVENGVVVSLARPGGNITGSSFFSDEVTTKRPDILKGRSPVWRVSASWATRVTGNSGHNAAFQQTAQALGVRVHLLEVRRLDQLDGALAAAATQAEALVVPDVLCRGHASTHCRPRHEEPDTEHRLHGGRRIRWLDWLRINFLDLWRRSMVFVDKILKGAKPADLPIEQASRFEFAINLKTAKALGLAIPPSLLLQADQVIE
jgi:putative ABC transport system substrate-binding protein